MIFRGDGHFGAALEPGNPHLSHRTSDALQGWFMEMDYGSRQGFGLDEGGPTGSHGWDIQRDYRTQTDLTPTLYS